MTDAETLKAEIRKLSSRATAAKMDLHDLAEDLPVNWESIMSVAQRTHDTYAALESKRAELKKLEA
ncbi:MAG: CCE_0567 family metalloprotein [Oricola sp.]